MLERHELDTFLTLAEQLHFGRTAELLHVSPARVSQTIAKLERRLGVTLFRRTSRRVELTAAGGALYAEVRPAWTAIIEAVTRTMEAGRGTTGTLRVAFVGAAAGQLLAGAAEAFGKRHPECEVVLREAQFGDVEPWLAADEADLVLSIRTPGLAQGPTLVSEMRMLAVALGHPYARRETVSLADVARTTFVEPRATLQETLTLVGAGRGVAEVGAQTRRYHPRPDVIYIPISGAPPVEWCLLWHEDRDTARVRAFSQVADELVHSSD
ncbi:DNA-binding transcriptional LysR family regulator [Catenulispora sp. GP43]|uniref:LysR family transcriptional regulator n=1 Tax=Catenulispora sp. GP43 TaxID=3156263 RepID=UPI0035114063